MQDATLLMHDESATTQNSTRAKLRSVHIVPTYACNLKCHYCYASKYIPKFPVMTWRRFTSILDRLIKSDVRHILLIGGEPTIWPEIDRAIATARTLGFSVSLLTNAMRKVTNVPHAITVNGTNLADPKLRATILKNLVRYREANVAICLRFNLFATDTEALLTDYARLAQQYADSVSFAPTVPYTLDRKLGKVLISFARKIRAGKQELRMSRAVPLCIFTPLERTYLKKHAGLYSRCSPANRQLTINPDGSMLPCVDLNIPQHIGTGDLNIEKKRYHATLQTLFEKPKFPSCTTCRHFPHTCQGGCLTMKCG